MQGNQNTLEIQVCKKSFDALKEAKNGVTVVISHNQYKGEITLKKVSDNIPPKPMTQAEIEKILGHKVLIVEEGQKRDMKYRKTKAEKFK